MFRKRTFIGGSILLAGVCFWLGSKTTDAYLQNIFVELFGLFLALAAGLLVVNVILENTARRRAVKSLLMLCNESIASFHNQWLDLCWAEFGADSFEAVAREYIKAGGKPEAIQKVHREKLYKIVKDNPELKNRINALEETMTEVSRLAGWSLDPAILSYCLDTRLSISRLREQALDDTDAAYDSITEHILDIDFRSQGARGMLLKVAGVSEG